MKEERREFEAKRKRGEDGPVTIGNPLPESGEDDAASGSDFDGSSMGSFNGKSHDKSDNDTYSEPNASDSEDDAPIPAKNHKKRGREPESGLESANSSDSEAAVPRKMFKAAWSKRPRKDRK